MKLCILAIGSRGDIQPAVALAAALAGRGHEVRFVAPENFGKLCAGRGFAFFGLPVDASEELHSPEAAILFSGGGSLVAFIGWAVKSARKWIDLLGPYIARSGEGMDLIVSTGLMASHGSMLSQAYKIPCVYAYWAPMLAANDFSFATFERAPPPMPGFVNRAIFHLFEQAYWMAMRRVERSQRKALGLPPAGFAPPLRAAIRRGDRVLLAYSEQVLPRSHEWPANVEVTGWWRLATADWTPPPALAAFLAAGPPPVYVGFGSMAFRNPQATLDAVLKALAAVGARAVISAGWGGLAAGELPASVCALDEAPHDWLFPRMAVIVHHGGAGTTGEAVRSGKPSVVTPFILDQFPWARLLNALGVAPPPVPHRTLTAENLAAALASALGDANMRANAEALGERVRAEDGVGRAVAAIERVGACKRA